MRYQCLNPDCRHSWDTRGEFVKNLRCPRCRKGYAVDEETFEDAVRARVNLLRCPIPPDVGVSEIAAKAKVLRKLFPMLPFDAFQVIDEEARQRVSQSLSQS